MKLLLWVWWRLNDSLLPAGWLLVTRSCYQLDDEWYGNERRLQIKELLSQQHLVSTVGSLLSSPSSFLFLRMFIFILFYFSEETRRKKINKRYEEVDGVRKEKERLTNDHRSLIFTFHLLSSTILFILFFLFHLSYSYFSFSYLLFSHLFVSSVILWIILRPFAHHPFFLRSLPLSARKNTRSEVEGGDDIYFTIFLFYFSFSFLISILCLFGF